jgi:hypothetical protein
MDTRDADRISRKWAATQGIAGSKGGWIAYEMGRGSLVCQGWGSFYRRFESKILDWLTQNHTAFTSFRQMTEETGETYEPTLLARGKYAADIRALADSFDEAMKKRGSYRRAYRGVGYERFVAVRSEKWYGGWTVRDTTTGQNIMDNLRETVEYHHADEMGARREAEGLNWRKAHGYPLGFGIAA